MKTVASYRLSTAVLVVALGAVAVPSLVCAEGDSASAAAHKPHVLQVGTHDGRTGAFVTIQDAVNAALPGDWVLVGEGDYKERGTASAGVLITTPGIHLRGMDRDRVIVDGTNAGFPACSADANAQDATPEGRDGVVVNKVDGVTVENLTACNFLSGSAGHGNQIWWNGGDGSGVIGMGSWGGAYLTATSTWFDSGSGNAGQYGIFVSNARGPGLLERSYASNMADSGFYVGACTDCNAVLRSLHAQNSALGYSGTNAGGHLVIEDSEWDLNRSGIVPSSLANDDPPSPQDGACPNHPGRSCTLIQHNYVHDNNNPSTPAVGLTAGSVIGSGIDLTGGRNNTVRENLIARNGSYGVLVNDYPDAALPAVPTWCQGGTPGFAPPPPFDAIIAPVVPCYFFATGNRVEHNRFADNGSFGNPSNADMANAALPSADTNCFRHNHDHKLGQPTTFPVGLQDPAVAGTCGTAWNPDFTQITVLFLDVICAAYGPASGACVTGGPGYPNPAPVQLLPIPRERGMEDPCSGVPRNSWCTNER